MAGCVRRMFVMRTVAALLLSLFVVSCTSEDIGSELDAGECAGDPSCPFRGGEEPDAGPGVCEVTYDREQSCRAICRDGAGSQLCLDQTSPVCYDECLAGVADVGWCP
jgi:hypothetical protein